MQNKTQRPDAIPKWIWTVVGGCVLVLVVAILIPSAKPPSAAQPGFTGSNHVKGGAYATYSGTAGRRRLPQPALGENPSAEKIVADKVNQFGRSRREIVERIARRLNKPVPPEVERFFDAIEGGQWEEIEANWQAMRNRSGQYEGSTHSPELDDFWPTVLDAYGVAEQAHLWPAQKLLDYGNAILDSLRPGMVYVGGTDPGRWIPELLNDTSDGERHIIVTQNAFADSRYLDYMSELYGADFFALTKEDSERAFRDYIADAQKRLQHDLDFPNEPKQVRPGEDIRLVGNQSQDSGQAGLWTASESSPRVQVSGQVAVMAINQMLLQSLMEKNPDLHFAIEQSFPFESMYGNTVPLGPIMELGVADAEKVFTPERAVQSVDYWRSIADQATADAEAAGSEDFQKTYGKLAAEQAALLLSHKFTSEAEQIFRSSLEICPYSPEAVFRYVSLLVSQNRTADALQVAENGLKAAPDNNQIRELATHLKTLKQ